MVDAMSEFIKNRPWIWIVAGFIVLWSAWGVFFTIAAKYQPEKVPLEHLQPSESE